MKLYDILGVKSTASVNEIRKAYHKLLLKYHPDKNPSLEAKEKLEEIKLAYEILSNNETRNKYSTLSDDKVTKLWWILQGFVRNINSTDLSCLLNKDNYENLEEFFNIFENLTLNDILSWFSKPSKLPKPNQNLDDFTESETNTWDLKNSLKLFNMPIKYLQNNQNDIKVVINSSLSDFLSNNVKKFKINRKINNIDKPFNFIVPLNIPYIIFPNAGDSINNNTGNLIFINCIEGWNWEDNQLILEKPITLYQMLYGLDIKLNLGKDQINYNNYIPHRDGWIINICQTNSVTIMIKLILEELSEEKQLLLYNYFN